MRQVYRLLGLVKRYGAAPTDTACGRALDLDVVSVDQDRRHAGEAPPKTPPPQPHGPRQRLAPARFARDPGEYRVTGSARAKPDWMTVIDGGALPNSEQDQQELW